MNASEFARREGKKLYVIDMQANKDRKIGRTGSPHLNVLQRFLRFKWHRGGKTVEKMCENLEALLAMSEEARAEFLARELEAMREAKKQKEKKDEI